MTDLLTMSWSRRAPLWCSEQMLRRRKILYLSFVQCRPGPLRRRDLYLEIAELSEDAPWDQGDQGLPPEGQEEGCQERQDQEECRQCQVQGLLCMMRSGRTYCLHFWPSGAVLKVLVHPEDHRQGEGWEAEAVSASGPAGLFQSLNLLTFRKLPSSS